MRSTEKDEGEQNSTNGDNNEAEADLEKKSQEVREFYEKIAPFYDLLTVITTFGFNTIWKQAVVERLKPRHGTRLLDVAGGTGEVAFRFLRYLDNQPNPNNVASCVTICDISEAMMNIGKNRAKKFGYTDENRIKWILSDIEDLCIESESMSAYSISFGMRHANHLDRALQEAYRVLEPGGRFVCLEFSHVTNKLVKSLLDWYSLTLIPVVRQILSGQWRRHEYLAESSKKFPPQEAFKTMMEKAGFRSITYENLIFGIAAIHIGVKPEKI